MRYLILILLIALWGCEINNEKNDNAEPKQNYQLKEYNKYQEPQSSPGTDEYKRLVPESENDDALKRVINGRYSFPDYSFSLKNGQLFNPKNAKGIGKSVKLKYDSFYKKANGSYVDSDGRIVSFEIELASKDSDFRPRYKYSTDPNEYFLHELEIVSVKGKTEIELKGLNEPLIFVFNNNLPESKQN